jgi:hypothetical protein
MIGVVDDEWAAPSRRGIIPHEGELIQGVDFRLEPASVVRGRATTGDGDPAAGARICLLERGANVEHLTVEHHNGGTSKFGARTETLRRWTTTDPDGGFAFHVGPGSFSLSDEMTISDDPFAYLRIDDDEYKHNFRVDGRAEILHDFRIIDPGAKKRIAINVRDETRGGEPAPGARIDVGLPYVDGLWMIGGPHSARADEHGTLLTRSMNCPMHIFARSADGSRGGFGWIGLDDPEATVSIREGTTAAGRVVAPDGTPVPRAFLSVYLAGPAGAPGDLEAPNPAGRNAVQLNVTCDVSGRYTLAGLPVGTRVHAIQPPFPRRKVETELGSIDFVVERLAPVTAPDLVFKPDEP